MEKTYQEQSNVERRSERGWWQREFRQRGSGKARSGSTTARSPAPSPGPETTVRRPVVRQVGQREHVREREICGRRGFIILLIFVVPSQGTGRCMYRIPGSAPGHHFLWGGGFVRGPPHTSRHSVLTRRSTKRSPMHFVTYSYI